MYNFDEVYLGLVDGDQYEEKNLPRQRFEERGNKSEVTVARLGDQFPDLFLESFPLYINDQNIDTVLSGADVIFMCVDNHKTRRMVSHFCAEQDNIVLISGGNDSSEDGSQGQMGDVQVFVRENGENKTRPPHEIHDTIENPPEDDEHPEEVEEREGCLEEQEGAAQLLISNNFAATLMLNSFHGLLTKIHEHPLAEQMGIGLYEEVTFDLRGNKVVRNPRNPSGSEKEPTTSDKGE
jgi:molybdopterin/thiamine biosynthesis adenylyltransferase